MSSTLGEKLRQAREERGISINEVAEQTRISPHYLDLIEQDDYRTLPGGIFNKGFIKSFAKYVGVDETEALQDYARQISAQTGEDSDDPKTYKPEVLTDDRTASSMVPTIIFAVVILGLMTAGILALVNYIQNNPSVVSNSNANSSAANTNTANTNANATAANANIAAPLPATNEIKLEFKALNEPISVEATVDGKKASKTIEPATPEIYTAQQNLKVRYYKGFADKVQFTLNGKQITPPAAGRTNGIEVEVTKDNIVQILQSGQFSAPAANANVNSAAAPR